ncbi:TetR family transcriptional regulator C-terminal domain-containing protein [Clavibacter michiganensis subsp. phaseoli]|uniref:TetR family transcriptional regulator C-terminal domain-containing protein n=1 Tax=Clavibacter phaseoli TaxID=1734031 RepID=UPI001FB55BBC|nr:TetR family transcriptional regulator C-terminal domain-containing protein [Clavibacter phaseoli]MCJ1711148.1 TetR family transcriptional regulator C-terminal domain-containing protein [Clavibacter phaseoli]
MALLIERVWTRVRDAAGRESGPEGARAILLELLPLDALRRAEMEVTVSFLALSIGDPSLRPAYSGAHQAIQGICAQALSHLGATSALVSMTHAIVDGLALHLLGQDPEEDASWAIAALDDHLNLLTKQLS